MAKTTKEHSGMEAWKEKEYIGTEMGQFTMETGAMERGTVLGEKKTRMAMCTKGTGRTTVVMEKE